MNINKMTTKVLSLVMVLALLLGVCAPTVMAAPGKYTAPATEENKEINYVSIGDSMANGYGFEGYEQGGKTTDKYNFHEGIGVYGDGAYPLQFEKYLEDEYGYDVNHTKLALSALLADDLLYLLGVREEEFNDEWSGYRDYDGKVSDADNKAFYQEAVTNADIITLGTGNASFGAFLVDRFVGTVGIMGEPPKVYEGLTLENGLALLESEEAKEIVLEYYAEMKEDLLTYVSELPIDINVDACLDVMAYTVASFIVSYELVIDTIVEMNPDVEIILVGLMNTTYGMTITGDGFKFQFGDFMGKAFDALNAYIAGVPAMKKLANDEAYAEASFYYAEQPEPKFICQVFDDLAAANWENIQDGRLKGDIVRDRNIDAYNGMIRPLISSMFREMLGTDLPRVTLSDVEAYTDAWHTAGTPMEISVAIYLALEDASIKATDTMEVTLDGLMSIAGNMSDVFSKATVDTSSPIAIRESLGNFLTSPEIIGMTKVYTLFKVGNGMSVHPTPEGHDEIVKSVIAAYENGHTAELETLKNIVEAIKEYYDEAYAYGYEKAVEEGIIDSLNAAIDAAEDAIADAEAWADKSDSEHQDALSAAAKVAKDVLAKVEALVNKGTIDDETYVLVNGLIADLAGSTDELADVLELALEDTKAAAEEAIEALVDEMNDKIAELKADAAAEKAAFEERAAARLEYLYELLKTSPEDAVAEILAEIDLVKTTLEETIAAIDAGLTAAIDATIEFYAKLIADINEATGGAVDALLAEYGDELAELEAYAAKLYAEIEARYGEEIAALKAAAEAKLNELYEKLANCAEDAKEQILAEIEAVKADLKAAVDAKIAELEAALKELDAEIAAKAAALKAQLIAQLTILNAKVQEIIDIALDINAALLEIVEDVKYIINVIDGYVRALLALDYEDLIAAAKALFDKYAPMAAEKVAEWLEAKKDEIINLLIACGEDIVDYAKANAEEILAFVGYVAEKFGAEASAVIEEILNNALTFDYTVSGESMILAIGGNYAVEYEEHYANVLAGLLKIDGQTGVIATDGLRISDLLAILDADYDNDAYGDAFLAELDVEALRELYVESIKASDLITVEFGVNDFTAFVVNQLLGKAIADHGETIQTLIDSLDMGVVLPELEAYELEWNRFGALTDVVNIDAALAEIKAQLIAKGLPEYFETELDGETIVIAVADYATYAIECFAYALTNYVYNYGAAIEAINAINPNAQIAVLGAINALQGISFEIDGTVINVGEYADYIVDALDAQTFLYALALPNTTYVPVQDAENYVAGAYGEVTYMDLIFVDFELVGEEDLAVVVKVNPEVLTPSAAGHAYIADQIYAAMNITCGHAYDWCLDETCNICGELRVAPGHVYSSPCDADCDVCGAIRSGVGHEYDDCYDAICNICGEERVITGHVYNNRCDAICNVCGFEREVEGHKYDNVCDEYCNTCGSKRETGGHKYTNACDVDCDICGTTRVPAAHEYDDCVDTTCNVCGKTRKAPGHTFGAWEIVKEATTTEAGEQKHTCKVCGATETEEIAKITPAPVDPKPQPEPQPDPKTGLSGGAIAGIAVGSVAVVAVAAFAVFWFAVKKSTFAALGAAIKGLGAKIAGLFKKG